MRDGERATRPNNAFEQTAGSHAVATAAQRPRSASFQTSREYTTP